MKKDLILVALLYTLGWLMGCASGKSLNVAPGPPQTSAIASGNWSLLGSVGTTGTLEIGGDLTANGMSVSGNVIVASSDGCYPLSPPASTVAVNGTISSGTLPLTAILRGSTIGITLTVPSGTSPATSLTGTYSVTGGCDDGQTGNIAAKLVTGTVGGTWMATDTVTGSTLSLDLSAASTPTTSGNLIGTYSLTPVALTLTGPSGCTLTGANIKTSDSFTAGSTIVIDVTEAENGIPSEFFVRGTVDSVTSPAKITGQYLYLSGGSCLLSTSTSATDITFTKQ